MNEKHELMIQRMVDDELDENQRAEFLKLADTNPELWRETALAFVEDRVWSSVVSEPASSESKLAATSNGKPEREAPAARRRPWWWQYGPQLMMTAALVMFVFALSLRFNPVDRSPGAPSDGDIARNNDPITEPEESPGPGGSQLVSQPMRLQVNDNFDVPVYEDPQRFREELQRLTHLDPGLLKRFEEAGYQVVPDIQYITGNSQDGRSFIVPIQRFQVRRLGQ